jgi:hypothetical protein
MAAQRTGSTGPPVHVTGEPLDDADVSLAMEPIGGAPADHGGGRGGGTETEGVEILRGA